MHIFAMVSLNVLAAAALCAILLAIGARLRRLLRVPVGPALRWSVDLQLGAWTAATGLLAASLAGLVAAPALLALLAALAVAGRWRQNRRNVIPLLIAAAGGLLSMTAALAPPFFYDAMVYHLGLPWQALVEGGWQPHAENVFAAFPALAQLLSLPALAVGLYRVPALVHWVAWVAAATGLWSIARRSGAPRSQAHLATIGCLLLPVTPLVPGFPAAGGWLMVGLIPALALGSGTSRTGGAALAGFLCGAATASRLQGLPWSALVLVLIFLRARGRVRPTAAAVGSWLLGTLPWWFKNLILLGDPIAPLLWDRPGLDTLWRDSGSLLKQGYSIPECLLELPRLLSSEAVWFVPLLLAAVLALVGRRQARRPWALTMAALFGMMAWSCTGTLPRFLAPTAFLILAIASAVRGEKIVRWTAAAAIAWMCAVGLWRTIGWIQLIDPVRLIPLDVRRTAHLVSPNDPGAAFYDARYLNEDARVLFVAEPRGFLFPRPFSAPSQHDPSPLQSMVEGATSSAEIVDALTERGFTHLLVNWGELRRLGPSYPVDPWMSQPGKERWTELVRDLQPPVVDRDGVTIYDLGNSSTVSVKEIPNRPSSSRIGS